MFLFFVFVFFFFFFFFFFLENLIKIEDARVATKLKIDFSNIQGQLTPQSRVESGSNSNSSKMLWLSLFLPRMNKQIQRIYVPRLCLYNSANKLKEELHTQGSHHPFTCIVKMSEKLTKLKLRKKVSKITLRIISKSHAHLQSMVKTSVKFQKNQNKTVGGVAPTR